MENIIFCAVTFIPPPFALPENWQPASKYHSIGDIEKYYPNIILALPNLFELFPCTCFGFEWAW